MKVNHLVIPIIISLLSTQVYGGTWKCKKAEKEYYQIESELNKNPYDECMSKPENQRPGRASVCLAAKAGSSLGNSLGNKKERLKKRLIELDKYLSENC